MGHILTNMHAFVHFKQKWEIYFDIKVEIVYTVMCKRFMLTLFIKGLLKITLQQKKVELSD